MVLLGLHQELKNNLSLRMQNRMGRSRSTSEAFIEDKHLQTITT